MFAILDNWRLKWKAVVGFSVLGLLIGALALNAAVSNRMLSGISAEIVSRDVASMSGLAELTSDVKELRIIVYSYYNAQEADDARDLEARLAKEHSSLIEAVDAYATVAGEEFAPEVGQLRAAVLGLAASDRRIFEMRRAGDLAGAIALIKGEGKKASRAVRDQIDGLLAKSRERAAAASAGAVAASHWTLGASIALALIAFAGLGVIAFVTDRTMARPLGELTAATAALASGAEATVPHRIRKDELGEIARAVEQFRIAAVERSEADARNRAELEIVTDTLQEKLAALSEGDLTAEIDQEFPPAFESIKANLNAALASLRSLIGSVSVTAETIRSASGEIAEASENLSRRTQANAANLEETTAAIAQMDGRLRVTAEAAERTVGRADGATTTVSGGRAITDEAVQAMERVSESAKGIDSVIEGLDKIAFQTRVLAMNAAVEAGRAGEAGRGFAVVADLVSALAMRAEEEAGRARDQLTATQSDIVTAVGMVQKVDQALSDIAADVGEVHALLGNMATDNEAQANAIGEISTAVTTMDQSTQQNAAMVEQTSAAARNLNDEVVALADQAARFRIGTTSVPSRRRPSRAIPALGARAPEHAPSRYTPAKRDHATAEEWTSF